MKYGMRVMMCSFLMLSLLGCSNSESKTGLNLDEFVNTTNQSIVDEYKSSTEIEDKEHSMKMFINDTEIPVTWEINDSVNEIAGEVAKNDIVVEMSMYSDNEQVGTLGKTYKSNDKQITTHNGDIVLYNSSNIVVFYGSNSWAYTRLGRMNLSENEVNELLANGDVILKMTK